MYSLDKVLANVIEAYDDLLKNNPDCGGSRVPQVQDGDLTVVKTGAEANSQAFLNAQPILTNFAPEVADICENFALEDSSDLNILEDGTVYVDWCNSMYPSWWEQCLYWVDHKLFLSYFFAVK